MPGHVNRTMRCIGHLEAGTPRAEQAVGVRALRGVTR